MERFLISLPPELRAWLQQAARREGMTMAGLIRRILVLYKTRDELDR